MKQRAVNTNGAWGSPRSRSRFCRGFTLIELCMVLFILIILMGVMMPAMQSAFVENAVRNDASQVSLMVRTAMLQSNDQHRPYVIDLTDSALALHPLQPAATESGAVADRNKASAQNPASDDVEVSWQLNRPTRLLAPDPKKEGAWKALPETTWTFRPGELCPATHLRLGRGPAWLEMDFNPLTGNVESEASYFP